MITVLYGENVKFILSVFIFHKVLFSYWLSFHLSGLGKFLWPRF